MTYVLLRPVAQGLVVGRASYGASVRRRGQRVTVFKSVGVAVQDLCAVARAVEAAEEQGIGTTLPLHSAT